MTLAPLVILSIATRGAGAGGAKPIHAPLKAPMPDRTADAIVRKCNKGGAWAGCMSGQTHAAHARQKQRCSEQRNARQP